MELQGSTVARYGPIVTVSDGFLRPSAAGPARTRDARRQALDPSRDKAIAGAVFQVLAELGYRGLTMDEVALAAGVGKGAIYRRWSSKADLLVSFLEAASDDAITVIDTGTLREDLLGLMTTMADILESPAGRATRALIGASVDEPAIAVAYRRGPLACWDKTYAEVLSRAADRGELSPGICNSVAAQAGPAIFYERWFVRGERLDEQFAVAVVDEVMLPLLMAR
ncbi:TetR/AcrR family transcriptional regulator [Blastococcus sp. CT_GayMR20]|nr:TetR/AcrR family transcriptional regulator [Blastococcus sp. CT_GayMR20]